MARKGNPHLLKSFPKIAPEGSAPKSVAVRVPANQYEAWMSLPSEKRNTYLREAIASLLKEENLLAS